MNEQVIESAAAIADEHGLDIEEALSRWEYSGASLKGAGIVDLGVGRLPILSPPAVNL